MKDVSMSRRRILKATSNSKSRTEELLLKHEMEIIKRQYDEKADIFVYTVVSPSFEPISDLEQPLEIEFEPWYEQWGYVRKPYRGMKNIFQNDPRRFRRFDWPIEEASNLVYIVNKMGMNLLDCVDHDSHISCTVWADYFEPAGEGGEIVKIEIKKEVSTAPSYVPVMYRYNYYNKHS